LFSVHVNPESQRHANAPITAAIGGKAQYVVTGDKADLLQLEEYQGVRIITARTFLRLLEDSPTE